MMSSSSVSLCVIERHKTYINDIHSFSKISYKSKYYMEYQLRQKSVSSPIIIIENSIIDRMPDSIIDICD